MCKEQTSVSQGSGECEVICLDAGLRIGGIRTLHLWNLVIELLHSSKKQPVQGDLLRDKDQRKNTPTTKKHSNRDDLEFINVDHVTSIAKFSHFGALFFNFRRQ